MINRRGFLVSAVAAAGVAVAHRFWEKRPAETLSPAKSA
jgi:hypothetical protein